MIQIRAVILGASGYTGAELLRLLRHHPQVSIVALTGETQAGKAMGEVYPHLRFDGLPTLIKAEQVDYANVDVVFCCLPHGTTQPIIAALPSHVRIVDLSADFRLFKAEDYEQWYGHPHQAMALQQEAVYGITEHARAAIKTARLVANPGCYPTSVLLPVLPLVEAGLIDATRITVDSASGISGAGRSAKQEMLFTEIEGGMSAYGLGKHRHMAEMEQEISRIHGSNIRISFTPHLAPMTRGMLSTIHVTMAKGVSVESLRSKLVARYHNEPFARVIESGAAPSTHQVRGTNLAMIGVYADRREGEAIVVCAIDNLVKGASGQALQNMNVMFGIEETTGLEHRAMFP